MIKYCPNCKGKDFEIVDDEELHGELFSSGLSVFGKGKLIPDVNLRTYRCRDCGEIFVIGNRQGLA